MSLLDNNRVYTQEITRTGSINSIDLSSGGNKGSIDVSGKNGLLIQATVTNGTSTPVLYVSPFSTYYGKLLGQSYDGRLFRSIQVSGAFWFDVSGLDTVYLYCAHDGGTGASASLTYWVFDEVPRYHESKPIQELLSFEIETNDSTTSYTAFVTLKESAGIAVLHYFKYLFFVGEYELNGTTQTCSISVRTAEVDFSGKPAIDRNLFNVTSEKTFVTDYIENKLVGAFNQHNMSVIFTSTPVNGATLHVKMYGVR